MPSSVVVITIGPNPPERLDKALARFAPEAAHLSRTRLARLISEGAVAQGNTPVTDLKARVAPGDEFAVTVAEAVETDIVAEAIPLEIVYEDNALAVVNKPAGMVVHPAPGSPGGTLVNALLHHFGGELSGVGGEKRPGIVHRIDKDTSGLLVVAKSDAAHHGLAAQFEAHSAVRLYRAVCHGVPDAGAPRLRGVKGVAFEPSGVIRITTGLDRHRTDRQRQAVVFQAGRRAVTRMRVLEPFADQAALVECWLETGRTHQIRVHAAHIGHGLIGDPVYGGRRQVRASVLGDAAAAACRAFSRQALHAAVLGFQHPVNGDNLRFEAPDPPDFKDLVEKLSTPDPEN